jgi:hypothetical protein
MGSLQRVYIIHKKIILLDSFILKTKVVRYKLNSEMQNSVGHIFLKLFEELAKIDNLLFRLITEKQRLISLI